MSNEPKPLDIATAWKCGETWVGADLAKHAMNCVRACAGMDDPEKEIARLRQRCDEQCEALQKEYAKNDALLALIREPCPTYDELRTDIETLRDALEDFLSLETHVKDGMSGLIDKAREALAKVARREATDE